MLKQNVMKRWVVICFATGLLACGSAEDRKKEYMEQGMVLFEEGRYEKAELAFKNVLQIDPKDSDSRYHLAETLSKQGEVKKAFAHYRSILASDELHFMSRIRVGQFLLMGRNLDDAEKMMQEAVELAPDNTDVLVFQAGINLVKNNLDVAVSTIEKALQQDPESSSAIVMRASIYAKTEEIDKAISLLKQGVAIKPDNEAMRLMLAKLYSKKGLKPEVEAELKALVNIKPDSLANYQRLVQFYLLDKKVNEAEAVLREAVVKMPDNEEIQSYLFDFIAQRQGLDKAIDEITVYIKQKPDGYNMYFKLATLHLQQKNIDAAEAVLNDVVELDKLGASGLKARNGLARLYVATKRVEQAKEMIKVVLAENPRDAEALTMRGQFALANKDISEAIADFRSALVGQPKNVKLLKMLSAAQVANKDIVLAIENMQKVVEIAPKDTAAKQGLVDLLFGSGKPLQAETEVNAILALEPENKKALEALFKIKSLGEDWESAQQIAEKMRAIDGGEAKGYYLSGLAFQAEKQWEKSTEAFKQVLLLKPEAVEPLTQIVKNYLILKKSNKALSFLKAVTEKQKGNFVAFNLMGEVLLSVKKQTEAEQAFRHAIEVKPEWFGAYRNLSLLLYINKEEEKAIDILRLGIEKTNGSMKLIDILASLYVKANKGEQVIQLYEQAYQQHPDSITVMNNLASYLSEFGGQEGLDRAEKLAVSLENSTNPKILDTVGWIAYQQGNYQKAQDVLESAEQNGAKDAVIFYHLGMIYYKQGDNESARSYFEKAISKKEVFKELEEAKKLLETIKKQEELLLLN